MTDSDQPKIIVDDDWKSAAQAEKEKLKAADEAAKDAPPPSGIPEQLGFEDLIRMLATQALMYLGAFPDPQTGKAVVSLEVAKLHIDLLSVLQEKTKGNLSDDEKTMVDGTLNELRVQFVEIAKAVEQAAADGTLEQMGGGMPGQPPIG